MKKVKPYNKHNHLLLVDHNNNQNKDKEHIFTSQLKKFFIIKTMAMSVKAFNLKKNHLLRTHDRL